MATPINIRSPRIIDFTGAVNDDIKCELFIWNNPNSVPTSPTYTLEKPIPTISNLTVYFDISPFCREYVQHVSYTEVTNDTAANTSEFAYCTVKVYRNGALQSKTDLICFDGFGYWGDGANPTHDRFLTEGTYYVESGATSGGLKYYNDGNSTWQAKWSSLQGSASLSQTLSNTVGYVPYLNVNFAGEGNKLEIIKDGVTQQTYRFEEVEECKYETFKCDFVNQWGAWQRIVFFKASRESFTMQNESYNGLVSDPTNYNTKKGSTRVFNSNASEMIICNTGWVPESYREVIKQMLLSEVVLLNDVPVMVESKDVELQKNINNRNINYQVSFKHAYKALNYNI